MLKSVILIFNCSLEQWPYQDRHPHHHLDLLGLLSLVKLARRRSSRLENNWWIRAGTRAVPSEVMSRLNQMVVLVVENLAVKLAEAKANRPKTVSMKVNLPTLSRLLLQRPPPKRLPLIGFDAFEQSFHSVVSKCARPH